jgi:hypothetical protein
MNATSSNISKEGNSGRENKKDQNTYTCTYAKKKGVPVNLTKEIHGRSELILSKEKYRYSIDIQK